MGPGRVHQRSYCHSFRPTYLLRVLSCLRIASQYFAMCGYDSQIASNLWVSDEYAESWYKYPEPRDGHRKSPTGRVVVFERSELRRTSSLAVHEETSERGGKSLISSRPVLPLGMIELLFSEDQEQKRRKTQRGAARRCHSNPSVAYPVLFGGARVFPLFCSGVCRTSSSSQVPLVCCLHCRDE